jgi:hypothetical protein
MVSSRLKSVRSRAASACSIPARWGCRRSRLRYSASSASVAKSVPRMSASAVRRIVGHGVLRGGPHQAVQRHHFRQALRPPTQPGRSEDRIQLQQAPHLMAHVHGPGFPFVLGRHPVGVDREAGPRAAGAGAWSPGARRERLDRGVAHERRLSRERGMQPLRRAEPRLFRARRQRAERADDALAGALRGRDGFDEEIVVVGRAADAPGRATEIHTASRVSLSSWHRQAKSLLHLVTISARRLCHRRNPRTYEVQTA